MTAERSNCVACQGRSRSDWCEVGDDAVRVLNRAKVCSVYTPGQIIFHQGQPCKGVYVVESGTIALRKSDSQGHSMLVRLVHSGETFGYRAYFARSAYGATAEALAPSRLCFIDEGAVDDLLNTDPTLRQRFLHRMAVQLQESEDARLHGVSLSVRGRVAHLLLVLRERFAVVDDHGVMTLELPLSRQDMADMVGTRPETIARTVKALTDSGVACFKGRRVTVRDLDALFNEVEDPTLGRGLVMPSCSHSAPQS